MDEPQELPLKNSKEQEQEQEQEQVQANPIPNTQNNMGLSQLVSLAKTELQALTGFKPESVISIKKGDNEDWKLNIELLERTSIPDKMDILGNYEVTMNSNGAIVSYDRKSLRKRGDTGTEEPNEDDA
jgi:hypothetical protein